MEGLYPSLSDIEDGILSDIQDWLRRALSWVGVKKPTQSPKTINTRVSCQDQDIIQLQEVTRKTSHPSIQEEDHFNTEEGEVPHPSIQQEEPTGRVPGGLDYGYIVSGIASRIRASIDKVGCKNLKTLVAQQTQNTNLPSVILTPANTA